MTNYGYSKLNQETKFYKNKNKSMYNYNNYNSKVIILNHIAKSDTIFNPILMRSKQCKSKITLPNLKFMDTKDN
jgi:hypothetical protein